MEGRIREYRESDAGLSSCAANRQLHKRFRLWGRQGLTARRIAIVARSEIRSSILLGWIRAGRRPSMKGSAVGAYRQNQSLGVRMANLSNAV